MTTAAEHFRLYDQARSALLGRHFALSRYHRSNLLSLLNFLEEAPPTVAGLTPDDAQTVWRWNVTHHHPDNPLMYGGGVQAMLAIEHSLGATQSAHILSRNLEAIDALTTRGGPDAGWIRRWDPISSDHWDVNAAGEPVRCRDFLIDAQGNYQSCVPAHDPRHVPRRTRDALQRLRAPGDVEFLRPADDRGLFTAYREQFRTWELSMDEVSGLLGGWAAADALVPSLQPRIRTSALRVIGRLADDGWTIIRPCGGFTARGFAGALSAFELPVDTWVRRIGGTGAASAIDFEGALRRAGYWSVLAGPVGALRAGITAGQVLIVPLLAGTPLATILAAAGMSLAGLGPWPLGLVAGIALHGDCLDVWDEGMANDAAVAAWLSALLPSVRLSAYFAVVAAFPRLGPAANFPPYLAMLALDDPSSPVRTEYLALIRAIHRQPLPAGVMRYGMHSALATAMGVVLGAQELWPVLEAQLAERHDHLVAAGRDAPVERDGGGPPLQNALYLLDYLVPLSIAWLAAARVPGAPASLEAPTSARIKQLTSPAVPEAVLQHVPAVRRVALGGAPWSRGDVPLYSGVGDRPRPAVSRCRVLPARLSGAPWECTYRVPRHMGDVPTDIILTDGCEFEITATGAIDAVGPDGDGPCDDARWPLHRGLDDRATRGALLAHLGGYVFVGARLGRRQFLAWRELPLFLRLNWDVPDLRLPERWLDVTVRVWGGTVVRTPADRVVSTVRWETERVNGRTRRTMESIGGVRDDGRRWELPVRDAIVRIREYGQRFTVLRENGPRVVVAGGRRRRPYLRTVGDGAQRNNLSSLGR